MNAAVFYRPALDGLRFIAFLAVFIHHALPQTPIRNLPPEMGQWFAAAVRSGGFGVDLFFILSSYLITELLLREQQLRGSIDVRAFYIRRALRIWPLYFVFLALAMTIVPHLLPREHLEGRHAIAFGLFGANWACAAWGYPASVTAPLWSVSVEEQFYVVWPVLLRRLRPERIARSAFVMLAAAWAARVTLAWQGTPHPAIWCNTIAHLDPIACGILTAVFRRDRPSRISPRASAMIGVAGAIAVVTAARFLTLERPWDSLLLYPAVTAGCWGLLVAVLDNDDGFLAKQPWVYLGRISYALYVFHVFALGFAGELVSALPSTIAAGGTVALGFVLTVALALISFHALEQPFLTLKQRYAHVRSRPDGA